MNKKEYIKELKKRVNERREKRTVDEVMLDDFYDEEAKQLNEEED